MSNKNLEDLYDDIQELGHKHKGLISFPMFCHAMITYSSGLLLYLSPHRDVALKTIENALECGDKYCKSIQEDISECGED